VKAEQLSLFDILGPEPQGSAAEVSPAEQPDARPAPPDPRYKLRPGDTILTAMPLMGACWWTVAKVMPEMCGYWITRGEPPYQRVGFIGRRAAQRCRHNHWDRTTGKAKLRPCDCPEQQSPR
jgi:hypothetical protein